MYLIPHLTILRMAYQNETSLSDSVHYKINIGDENTKYN